MPPIRCAGRVRIGITPVQVDLGGFETRGIRNPERAGERQRPTPLAQIAVVVLGTGKPKASERMLVVSGTRPTCGQLYGRHVVLGTATIVGSEDPIHVVTRTDSRGNENPGGREAPVFKDIKVDSNGFNWLT